MKTPFEQAGFKPTDTFTLKEGAKHHVLKQGDTFTLKRDDGTGSPYLWNSARDEYHPVYVGDIKVVEQKPEAKTLP